MSECKMKTGGDFLKSLITGIVTLPRTYHVALGADEAVFVEKGMARSNKTEI
jgi:hypothetical protein